MRPSPSEIFEIKPFFNLLYGISCFILIALLHFLLLLNESAQLRSHLEASKKETAELMRRASTEQLDARGVAKLMARAKELRELTSVTEELLELAVEEEAHAEAQEKVCVHVSKQVFR